MAPQNLPAESPAPVFVLVDDDREAAQRITLIHPGDWFFVPVHQPAQAVRYARHFAPTAVLLAEPIDYPRGGAERLLQQLLDEVGKPVIILSEDPDPQAAARWRRMGASDCIPHPTRTLDRMRVLHETLKGAIAQREPGAALTAPLRLEASRPEALEES